MGLKHLFSRKSKKKKEDNFDPFGEGAQVFENPFYVPKSEEEDLGDREPIEAAPQKQEDDMEISEPTDAQHNGFLSAISGKDELFQLSDILAKSSKGGLGKNSEKYDAVHHLLIQIEAAQITNRLGADKVDDDIKSLSYMMELYSDLIDACGVYLNRKSHTKAGKARQAIVSTIKSIAERDTKGIGRAMDEIAVANKSERSKISWRDLLKVARTDQYVIPNLTAASGGASSEVYMFDNPDKSSKTKKLFFKPETKIDFRENFGVWLLNKYKDLHPDEIIEEDTVKAYYTASYSNGNPTFLDQYKDAAEKIKDKKGMQALQSPLSTLTKDVFGDLKANQGEQDITGRNVATSRVADLLGVGDLVARSRFAEVDDGKGNKRRGIVMEGASGKKAADWVLKRRNKMFAKEKEEQDSQDAAKEGKSYQRVPGIGYTDQDAHEFYDEYQGENEIYQPTFFKDLSSLQVLDCICGQIDRNLGNIFLKRDEKGRLTGVTGIDNDAAFGRNIKPVTSEGGNRTDREVFDDDGNLSIPHMDAALAERIKALSPQALRMALADILGPEEIDAAAERLKRVQQAIGNAKEGQILENDSDWAGPKIKADMMMDAKNGDYSRLSNEYLPGDKIAAELREKYGGNVFDLDFETRKLYYADEKRMKEEGKAKLNAVATKGTYMKTFAEVHDTFKGARWYREQREAFEAGQGKS